MYTKRVLFIEDNVGLANRMRSDFSRYLRLTHDERAVEIRVMPNIEQFENERGVDVLVLSCNGNLRDYALAKRGIKEGARKVVLTHEGSSHTKHLVQRIAKEINAAGVIQKPEGMEETTQRRLFSGTLAGLVYKELTSTDGFGVIGTGNIGGAAAFKALELAKKYGIKKILLYNGINREKADQLCEGLEGRLLDSSADYGDCEVVVTENLSELKLGSGIIAYAIGHARREKRMTRDPKKTRRDFLSMYLEPTLNYARQLTGFTGNLICLTNPVALLLSVLYAGSYKEPDEFDLHARCILPEGLSMSDRRRGVLALTEMGREAGVILNGNGTKRYEQGATDLKVIGSRDNFVIINPTVTGLTLNELQAFIEEVGGDSSSITEKRLRERMTKLGIGRIRETETYHPDAYSDDISHHIGSIRTGYPMIAAVSLVNLLEDCPDYSEKGYYTFKNGSRRSFPNAFGMRFPNGVMTGWEILHNQESGQPVNLYIEIGDKRKILLDTLLDERSLLLEELNRIENSDMPKSEKENIIPQIEKVRRFFHKPFRK